MAIKTEPTAKWIRGLLDGETVVDSRSVRLVWEHRFYPQYYVPMSDLTEGLLTPTEVDVSEVLGPRTPVLPWGTPQLWSVGGGSGLAVSWPSNEEVGDHVRFQWDALDHWFEEDEEVYVHPRDPYTRIDVQPSSRHVRVEVDGVVVADTRRPVMLFETGLPPRTYIPKTDVRMDLLEHSDTVSACPYKGHAEYWSVAGRPDLAWSYRTPLSESAGIGGLIAFWDEKVDVIVDGERRDRPKSPFS